MHALELTPEEPVDALVEYALAAESAGFDAVFASHHYNNRDQFLALGAIAEATESVRVGPGVANPYETHPVTLASRVATLQEVSTGRAVFGLGAGDRSTLRNLGVDRDRPLGRVLETTRVARRLWRGERVDHEGTFQARDAGLNYTVDPVPVYVGAQGPHMTRMAAKHADGVLFNGAHPRDLAWAAERVAEGLDARGRSVEEATGRSEGTGGTDGRAGGTAGTDGRAEGAGGIDGRVGSPGGTEGREPGTGGGDDSERDGGAFDFLAYASVSVAEDEATARAAARLPVAFIAAGAPDAVLDRHDLEPARAAEVGEAVSAGEFEAAADLVTAPMVDAFCIAGTPDAVGERTAALREYVDGVVFAAPLGPDVEAAIPLLARAWDRSTR